MRLAFAMLVAFAGCIATLPSDPSIMADLACEGARAVLLSRHATPDDPKPTPRPGDKCQTCNGTGRMPTDGRIIIECSACGGTGKVKASAAATTICPDGRCSL